MDGFIPCMLLGIFLTEIQIAVYKISFVIVLGFTPLHIQIADSVGGFPKGRARCCILRIYNAQWCKILSIRGYLS